MNALLDRSGDTLPGLLAEYKNDFEDFVNRQRMLDGSYAVQVLGEPSEFANITFYCSRNTRGTLMWYKTHGYAISVIWHDATRICYIAELTFESHWPKVADRQEKVTMKLLLEAT